VADRKDNVTDILTLIFIFNLIFVEEFLKLQYYFQFNGSDSMQKKNK
jgi:hypothetical protein